MPSCWRFRHHAADTAIDDAGVGHSLNRIGFCQKGNSPSNAAERGCPLDWESLRYNKALIARGELVVADLTGPIAMLGYHRPAVRLLRHARSLINEQRRLVGRFLIQL